ncbi:reductase [Virgisporangium aliadipatigenens]|uniref:Reductase n=1 Tax=Virgisporangium aliadipatigenens TaxID=741659 RepID=A0A8J4DNY2_9ACTN|nr:reductase [Virgisporangium aliadipatigenens]
MRILVLGGTRFVGHAVVTAALAAGHHVTTFNRGSSGDDVPGAETIRGDRNRDRDLTALAERGPWDAVIDTSGYVPRNVGDVARGLERAAERYLFVSTVSVYADWPVLPLTDDSPVLVCPPDAGPDFGNDTEDGPTRYGYQKAGCEAAVAMAFGHERTTVLRPGVVLGRREYVGRLPWWLRRVARGGRVLAPGAPSRTIQPVDVRDLAEFAVSAIERGHAGSYNVCAPRDFITFEELLRACIRATRSDAELVWVPDQDLVGGGVRQWSELPLWRTFPGVWQVDAARARRLGLRSRPIAETVASTWEWLCESGERSRDARATEIGISPEREARLLGAR